jgi:hypothetical protein
MLGAGCSRYWCLGVRSGPGTGSIPELLQVGDGLGGQTQKRGTSMRAR